MRGDAYLGNAMAWWSDAMRSSGEAPHSMARQRNGKVKSRRAQKRKGKGMKGEALFGNGIEMNRSAMEWQSKESPRTETQGRCGGW